MRRLTSAKRRRPPLRDGLVSRPRLVRPLLGSADLPLALVVAPAGYGKTTILCQWAERDRRPFAWVTLDEGDNEPRRLLASIAAVLGAIEPIESDTGTLTGLLHAIESRKRAFVLVLDDVHALRAPKALQILAAIVDHLPWGSQLALGSRDEPRIPVGRLRANRNVVELRFGDLVMTSTEGTALLRKAGVALGETQAEAILRGTEGWAAALYLAALSLGERTDLDTAVAAFGGCDRRVADYLRDEVLSELSPDEIQFLTRAAVLDRLCGALCDAVLDRTDSGRVLAQLECSNVLLFPAEHAGCYRCHRLLAQMLRRELARSEPELEPELHRRAASWHAGEGDIARAVRHATAAHEAGRAGDLLWAHLLRYTAYGQNASIQRWLDRFTDEEIATNPSLALAAAGSALARGDGNLVKHWTSAATERLGEVTRPAEPSLEGGVAILRAAAGGKGIAGTLEDAERAYELFNGDDPWRSLCCLLIGTARHLGGDRAAARRALGEGARRGAVRAPSIQALCLAQLALVALDERDWANADAHALRARGQIERCGALDYPTSALVFAVAAAAHARAGRIAEAKVDAGRAGELAAKLVDFAPFYEAEIRLALARTALRLSDVTGARGQLGHASRLLLRSGDAVVLDEWLEELWVGADTAAAHSVGDRWSLTTAELRVLQFLPTHLSFPEIAGQLNVTANTVKTHSRAVYRKLDASSRAEAVSHALNAGLIDAHRLTLAEAA